jgi:hypothetical protein
MKFKSLLAGCPTGLMPNDNDIKDKIGNCKKIKKNKNSEDISLL